MTVETEVIYDVEMVGEVGDDGEYLVALGHVEPRRFAAACQAYARQVGLYPHGGGGGLFGRRTLGPARPLSHALARTAHRMARFTEQGCDCGADHGEGEGWSLNWGESTPGRDVPVTVLDWFE
jgi:hypothetical protein